MAAAHGLELTPIEQSALSNLRLRRFAERKRRPGSSSPDGAGTAAETGDAEEEGEPEVFGVR